MKSKMEPGKIVLLSIKCCEPVLNRLKWLRNREAGRECSRWASVTRNSKPYCWQHDPGAIADRMRQMEIKSMERFQAKYRTLSRDTAIKLVEAADTVVWDTLNSTEDEHRGLYEATQTAKRELGI